MPVQHRRVEVAPGHRLLVRRARGAADQPGYIMVRTRKLPPFALAVGKWDAGEIQR